MILWTSDLAQVDLDLSALCLCKAGPHSVLDCLGPPSDTRPGALEDQTLGLGNILPHWRSRNGIVFPDPRPPLVVGPEAEKMEVGARD